MTLSHLRTLVAIADHGSFAAAAERLFVTPAAVSHQMRALESELGCPLFDRTGRPPRLNAHGESVVLRGREILARFDAFATAARAPGEIAGRITIGCVGGVSSVLIPQALTELRSSHPGLKVRIEEGLSAPLAARVRRRELDAAIVTELPQADPELQALPITEDPLVVVAPPGTRETGWAEALAARPFLRLNRDTGIGALIDRTLRDAGLVLDEAMELDSSETVVGMVRAGLGAGVIPSGRLDGLAPGTVSVLPFGEPPVTRRVVFTERRNAERTALSHTLYEVLQRLVRRQRRARR